MRHLWHLGGPHMAARISELQLTASFDMQDMYEETRLNSLGEQL